MTEKCNVDKMSRVVLNINNQLIVKIHCRLTKEVNGVMRSFHNFFTYGDSSYLNLDHSVYLTLEIKQELTAWNKEQTIMITNKNIHQFLSGLQYMINLCKRSENIYYYTTQSDGNDKITVHENVIKEHIMQLRLIGDDMPRILIHPSIKIDRNDMYHPGIRIYFNRKTIFVDITIDEAESLYYNLSKVDFFQYGMSMIQYYVSSIENNKIEIVETKCINNGKRSVSFNDTKVETTKSILQKDKSDKEFFGL